METKVCKGCSQELPIDAFGRDTHCKDNKSTKCKKCINAYQKRLKEKKQSYYLDKEAGPKEHLIVETVEPILRGVTRGFKSKEMSTTKPSGTIEYGYVNVPSKKRLEQDIRKMNKLVPENDRTSSWISLIDIFRGDMDGEELYIYKYGIHYKKRPTKTKGLLDTTYFS